ncbi:MAG: hypothetical protein AAF600_06785 [Bacteroidota bacterium]
MVDNKNTNASMVETMHKVLREKKEAHLANKESKKTIKSTKKEVVASYL